MANNTAQFSTNVTRDFFGIELLYNHYKNIKILQKNRNFSPPIDITLHNCNGFTNVTTTAQFYANKQVPEGTKFNKFSGIHFKFSGDP